MARGWFGRRGQKNTSSRCLRKFSYASLRIATDNFSSDRLIGKGGSATIYKGLLEDGTVVAVKKYISKETRYAEVDFLSIVEIMSRIQHQNINQVIGCCMEKEHRLLVTEYAENGSVSDILHNLEIKESIFNWHMRASILIGTARGLSYLHEDVSPRVIHRDIKASNILLDRNFTPKITDFDTINFIYDSKDLPLLGPIIGTLEYSDPEYFGTTTECTEKVDVYGFGVVVLEIISGRKPIKNDQYIIHWASELDKNDRVLEIVDPVLSDFHTDDVQRFIRVALLCTQFESKLRPSMHEVLLMLHGVCNSCRQALMKFDMHRSNDARDFPADTEDEGNGSILRDEDIREVGSADVAASSGTEVQIVEASRAQQHTEEDNVVTDSIEERSQMTPNLEADTPVQQQQQQKKNKKKCGVILSGSDDVVERLSQTMVFKKYSEHVSMEAVYPPLLTREYPIRTTYKRQP